MPNKFKQRSEQAEMLDTPGISQSELFKNLRELDILNRTFGGHRMTMQAIQKLVTDQNKTYQITDLGCGSGDTLKYIATWARIKGFKMNLTGVDMNPDAIDYLNIHCNNYPEIKGIVSSYSNYLQKTAYADIIHCSLFCHHLSDEELLTLFDWIKIHVHTGFIINDLQRHWLAYYSTQLFTNILNASRLAKNDGPISVLRGFKLKELRALLQKADITKYSIERKWAFRYLVVGWQ